MSNYLLITLILTYFVSTFNHNKYMAKFKQEVLDIMKSDPDLFYTLCKALDVKPSSLPNTIDRNGNNINQYSIVTLVANHLGKDPAELLEEEPINATVK